jgi:hypothetical protein
MATAANLTTRVNLCWTNQRGHERETEVEVEYTYDGDDLRIVAQTLLAGTDPETDWFDDMVFDAVAEVCDEQYAEWLADFADWQDAA